MSTRWRVWLGRIAKAVIVIAITWGLFRATGLDLAQLDVAEIARLNPSAGLIALSMAGLIAMCLGHAFLWRRIVSDISGTRLTFASTIRVYFLANLGRYIPGKFWQVAGMAVLARNAGVHPVAAVGAAVLGQIAFLASGVALAAGLLPGALDLGPILWVGTTAVIIAATVYAIRHTGLFRRLGRRMDPRITQSMRDAALMAREIRPSRVTTWFVAYTLSWLVLAAAFTAFAAAFVPMGGAAAFPRLAGIIAASYLAGYVAIIAPAGVGVREGVMGLLLAQIMPAPAAVIVAVASRAWFTVAELAPVAVIPLLRQGSSTAGPEQGSERLVAL